MRNPLLIFIALVVAFPLSAGVRVGPVAVTHWPNLVGDGTDPTRYESEQRYAAGVVVELDLGHRSELLLRPSFLEKGGVAVGDDELTRSVRLEYAELPVLLRRSFGSGRVRPYIAAGPSFSWLREANVVLSIDGGEEESDLSADLPRFEIGVVAAAGISVDVGTAKLFVDAGIAQGLTNLDISDETAWSNQGVAITTGVVFSIRGK